MTVLADTYRPRYQVERLGGCWRIVDPKGQVMPGSYTDWDAALTRRDQLQTEADRAAKRGPRRCMCCRREFQSEGIHHRLCGHCRSHGDRNPVTAGATSIGKIRRAAQA